MQGILLGMPVAVVLSGLMAGLVIWALARWPLWSRRGAGPWSRAGSGTTNFFLFRDGILIDHDAAPFGGPDDALTGLTEWPDLRRSGALENRAAWLQIVHGGALSDNGMASFAPSLSEDEVEAIRQYVIKRANEDKAMEAERAKTRVAAR